MGRDFSHLFSIPVTSSDWSFKVSLKGFEPPVGGSDKLPPGNYKGVIKDLKLVPKKDDQSKRNFLFLFDINGPEAYAGNKQRKYVPVPTSDDTSNGNSGYETIRRIIWSIASGSGTLENVLKAEEFAVNRASFVGKTVYFAVKDSEDPKYSEISWFISADDYNAKPGPSEISLTVTSSAQTHTPDAFNTLPASAPMASANGSNANAAANLGF